MVFMRDGMGWDGVEVGQASSWYTKRGAEAALLEIKSVILLGRVRRCLSSHYKSPSRPTLYMRSDLVMLASFVLCRRT